MLTKKTQLKLTDLMEDNFTDLDIYREKPFVFESNDILLIVKPVLFKEHDRFLKDMSKLIIEHYEIFLNIDFLSNANYRDKGVVDDLVAKFNIYTADAQYTRFKKNARNFILKWAFVSKKRSMIKLQHNKRLCKKFIDFCDPSEFIYILFLLFAYNFSIVKKNLLEFMKMFKLNMTIESNIQMGTSSLGTSEKVVLMPKFSREPFSASTLNLLEQQSKIR